MVHSFKGFKMPFLTRFLILFYVLYTWFAASLCHWHPHKITNLTL